MTPRPPVPPTPALPALRLPLGPRRLTPGATVALLAHAAVLSALLARGRTAPDSAGAARPAATLNFFVVPQAGPASVDVPPAPRVSAAELATLRRIAVELPPLTLAGPVLPAPVVPTPGGPSGAENARAAAPATGAGSGAGTAPGNGTGPGTGDGGGYIFHAAPRTAILPPLARVPGSVTGRTLRVSFWVATDGRVTRVEVDPPIADATYNREFQRRMLEYQFYPAHTRGGQNVDDVVTVPLRIGN
ncbi:MAG TPA: hypothetical protein VM736_00755 [Gemmatimonadales bacterium]|nr:hypothetical protein [Gemmatimonadales bacterium]